jgi:hypothetical protein
MIFVETVFARSSVSFSMGPKVSAFVVQVRTQAGSMPRVTLVMHESHFAIVFPSGNWGAPKGHIVAQA